MSNKTRGRPGRTVAEIESVMETIAPTALAQEWDHVGLVAGDRTASVKKILLCIDLTPAVAEEAIRKKVDLVLAYHPPIFRPITSLIVPSDTAEAAVFRCIRSGIAVYTTHTALDAADGGTNDVIASLIGITKTEPIEFVDDPAPASCKLVVFVPAEHVERVGDALFEAGAGRIGDYSRCSYRSSGRGTFFGGASTQPLLGQRGKMEVIDELRLETIVPKSALPAVVAALRTVHPYDEPAFDVYPRQPEPVRGIGRWGTLPRPTTLLQLARKLKRKTPATAVQIVGEVERSVERAVIVVGAAGSLPFKLPLTEGDVIITGEIRHHDALSINRRGCSAIALGHWASERPVLVPLAARIATALSGLTITVSEADRDPFGAV